MQKLEAIVEIPAGSKYKYEVDEATGALHLDRVLEIELPFNYGYLPNTLGDDGDPLDVFIVSSEPIPPLTRVSVVKHTTIRCVDNGVNDDKIICTVAGEIDELTYDKLQTVVNVVVDFLESYKEGMVVIK